MGARGETIRRYALGVLLFLLVPAVLLLLVLHPEPVAASLGGAAVLAICHHLLARPYEEHMAPRRCVWCGRFLSPEEAGEAADPKRPAAAVVSVTTKEGELELRTCAAHREPAERFLSWLVRIRPALRAGLLVPIVALVAALLFAAFGDRDPLERVTALFELVVGLTLLAVVLGHLRHDTTHPLRTVVPLGPFHLVGIRATLWVFGLLGLWWFGAGAVYWLRLLVRT